MNKELIAKIVIFLLTAAAGALGAAKLDPEMSVYVDGIIGALAGVITTFLANWLHKQEPPVTPL